ncbi:histidine kinase [Roseateles sp.]|uniref:sensor histidine kinase n=1 Tax=Roseateles sp. TaxID=1971397 RepID=UPI0031DB1ECF
MPVDLPISIDRFDRSARAAVGTDHRELLLAAVLSAVLASGLVLPKIVTCALGAMDESCAVPPQGWFVLWLGFAVWNGALWLAAILSRRWLIKDGGGDRVVGLGLQILLLAMASPAIGAVIGQTDGHLLPRHPYELQMHAMFASVACLTIEYRRRRQAREQAAEALQREAPMLDRQLDEARSALLHAQVEPHFLFNTLAHVRRLAQTDPPAAHAMLGDLRRYLSAALPELRQTQTPLARELDLVRAFLALHQRRIGEDRLTLRFEIAPGLDEVVVPSTCLLTLAENAIKHGITPMVEGGEIAVLAGPDPERPGLLRLEVADTGAGMTPGGGTGTGLVTLQAKLAALHGGAAKLSLLLNQPRGLIARVELPWSRS